MKSHLSPHLYYGNLSSSPYVRLRFQHYLELVTPFLTPLSAPKILDVGGYTADLLPPLQSALASKKLHYHVVDHDTQGLKLAKKRGADTHKLNLQLISPLTLFPPKHFDLIVCTEVLEHLLHPESILLSLYSLLKDDGRCLISLPNENTFFHRLKTLFGFGIDTLAFKPHKHLHFPTISQSRQFISSRFTIIDSRYFIDFGPPTKSPLSLLISLVPTQLWQTLANFSPNLFARGTIFLCQKKPSF